MESLKELESIYLRNDLQIMDKKDIENSEELFELLNVFYSKVREDEEIGSIFNSIIKDWDFHLLHITEFWKMQLWGNSKYQGNPILTHQEVDKKVNHTIKARDFGTWLFYWINTIDEMYEGKNAEKLKFKARKMQTIFYLNIEKERLNK